MEKTGGLEGRVHGARLLQPAGSGVGALHPASPYTIAEGVKHMARSIVVQARRNGHACRRLRNGVPVRMPTQAQQRCRRGRVPPLPAVLMAVAATVATPGGGEARAAILCLRSADGSVETLRIGGDTLFMGNGNQAGIVGGQMSFTPAAGEGSGGTMNGFIVGLADSRSAVPLRMVRAGSARVGALPAGDTVLAQSSFGMGPGNPCAGGSQTAANTPAMLADLQRVSRAADEIVTRLPIMDNPAQAFAANATAVGRGSVADRDNTVSIGASGQDRQLAHVAAGTVATDAVNVQQLGTATANAVRQSNRYTDEATANQLRYDTDAQGHRTSTVSLAGAGGQPVAIRNVAAGTADRDAANVGQVHAAATDALRRANQYTDAATTHVLRYDVAGDGSRTGAVTLAAASDAPVALRNVAAGVSDTDAVNTLQLRDASTQAVARATGYTDRRTRHFQSGSALAPARADGVDAVAVGGNATGQGRAAVAIGANAVASADGAVALGAGANASRGPSHYTDPVSGAARDAAGEVSVGALGAERHITNVADGAAATDAVTLRQLQAGVSRMQRHAEDYTDQRIAVGPGGEGPRPVATASNAVAIGPGSIADRPDSVSVGAAGMARQITNVAPGVASTDAVNLGQLHAVSQQARRMIGAAGAMSAAMAAMLPNPRAAGPLSVSIGTGTYGGATALAAGVNYQVSERLLLNLKAATAVGTGLHGNQMLAVGAGATFGF